MPTPHPPPPLSLTYSHIHPHVHSHAPYAHPHMHSHPPPNPPKTHAHPPPPISPLSDDSLLGGNPSPSSPTTTLDALEGRGRRPIDGSRTITLQGGDRGLVGVE